LIGNPLMTNYPSLAIAAKAAKGSAPRCLLQFCQRAFDENRQYLWERL
jgi:hypothetical protein